MGESLPSAGLIVRLTLNRVILDEGKQKIKETQSEIFQSNLPPAAKSWRWKGWRKWLPAIRNHSSFIHGVCAPPLFKPNPSPMRLSLMRCSA